MTESQLQEAKKIEEAIEAENMLKGILCGADDIVQISGSDEDRYILQQALEKVSDLTSLARSYLHAMQSGVPEEKKLTSSPEDVGMGEKYEWFNSCRQQMLPLIVVRDRMLSEKDERIRELERRLR